MNPPVFFGKLPVVEGAESGYADVLQIDITRHNRIVRQGGDGWIFGFAVGDPEGFLHGVMVYSVGLVFRESVRLTVLAVSWHISASC